MGPRPCGRGRPEAAGQCLQRPAGFNGATALRPWTVVYAAESGRGAFRLQWGHGLAAVDGRKPRADRHQAKASMGPRPCGRGRAARACTWSPSWPASMGPRPCGRGRAGTTTTTIRRAPSFNGATALRPWTAHHVLGVDWEADHCFNGATALRPWTASQPPPGRTRPSSFNGATALRPWTDQRRAITIAKRI